MYLHAFDEIVAPVADRFAPTWVIVSAGFDAHRERSDHRLGLAAGDYCAADRRGRSSLVPAGRRLVMLEGGYDLDALDQLLQRGVRQLAGVSASARDRGSSDEVEGPTSAGPGSAGCRCSGRSLAAAGLAVIPDRFRPVLAELSPLTERFSAAGHRLYLVGGTVRDLLIADDTRRLRLRRHHRRALPAQIKACLDGWADAIWTQGERFGTIGAKKNGRTYEITTHRAEAYNDDSRKPDVEFSDEIEVDLSRRDFTINAMALELTAATPRRSSIHSVARSTWRRELCVRHCRRRSASATIRCACCARRGSSPAISCNRWPI